MLLLLLIYMYNILIYVCMYAIINFNELQLLYMYIFNSMISFSVLVDSMPGVMYLLLYLS